MPYDFILMRLPRPTQPGLEALNNGPQPIQRGQITQVLDGLVGVQPSADGRFYTADPPGGPHIEIHLDPKVTVEFLAVEFDRYDTQADYVAARALVDQLCAGLRLTITDDPDVASLPPDEPDGGGGLLGRLRGLFGGGRGA